MTRSHGSIQRLSFIAHQLQTYVEHEVRRLERPLKRRTDATLPPAFELAFLRGEAILRLRFFEFCETFGFGLEQTETLLDLWGRFLVDRSRISELARKCGLVEALATQASLPVADDELAYCLFCGLVDDLERQGEKELLRLATDAFFAHHFRELFPEAAPVQKAPRKDREDLRFQALTRLSKRHKQPVDLKESFAQEPDEVRFHLRLKIGDGPWQDQPEIAAKRLKSARQAAYAALLKGLG